MSKQPGDEQMDNSQASGGSGTNEDGQKTSLTKEELDRMINERVAQIVAEREAQAPQSSNAAAANRQAVESEVVCIRNERGEIVSQVSAGVDANDQFLDPTCKMISADYEFSTYSMLGKITKLGGDPHNLLCVRSSFKYNRPYATLGVFKQQSGKGQFLLDTESGWKRGGGSNFLSITPENLKALSSVADEVLEDIEKCRKFNDKRIADGGLNTPLTLPGKRFRYGH